MNKLGKIILALGALGQALAQLGGVLPPEWDKRVAGASGFLMGLPLLLAKLQPADKDAALPVG